MKAWKWFLKLDRFVRVDNGGGAGRDRKRKTEQDVKRERGSGAAKGPKRPNREIPHGPLVSVRRLRARVNCWHRRNAFPSSHPSSFSPFVLPRSPRFLPPATTHALQSSPALWLFCYHVSFLRVFAQFLINSLQILGKPLKPGGIVTPSRNRPTSPFPYQTFTN